MNWIIYALGAIMTVAISDLFRKLGSNLKDPFQSNLIFQLGSISMALLLWIVFSRKIELNSPTIVYTIIGGLLISIFTALSFKALELGPGVSIVIPILRVGGVLLVTVLGILLFKEKLSFQLVTGVLLALCGLFLIFVAK